MANVLQAGWVGPTGPQLQLQEQQALSQSLDGLNQALLENKKQAFNNLNAITGGTPDGFKFALSNEKLAAALKSNIQTAFSLPSKVADDFIKGAQTMAIDPAKQEELNRELVLIGAIAANPGNPGDPNSAYNLNWQKIVSQNVAPATPGKSPAPTPAPAPGKTPVPTPATQPKKKYSLQSGSLGGSVNPMQQTLISDGEQYVVDPKTGTPVHFEDSQQGRAEAQSYIDNVLNAVPKKLTPEQTALAVAQDNLNAIIRSDKTRVSSTPQGDALRRSKKAALTDKVVRLQKLITMEADYDKLNQQGQRNGLRPFEEQQLSVLGSQIAEAKKQLGISAETAPGSTGVDAGSSQPAPASAPVTAYQPQPQQTPPMASLASSSVQQIAQPVSQMTDTTQASSSALDQAKAIVLQHNQTLADRKTITGITNANDLAKKYPHSWGYVPDALKQQLGMSAYSSAAWKLNDEDQAKFNAMTPEEQNYSKYLSGQKLSATDTAAARRFGAKLQSDFDTQRRAMFHSTEYGNAIYDPDALQQAAYGLNLTQPDKDPKNNPQISALYFDETGAAKRKLDADIFASWAQAKENIARAGYIDVQTANYNQQLALEMLKTKVDYAAANSTAFKAIVDLTKDRAAPVLEALSAAYAAYGKNPNAGGAKENLDKAMKACEENTYVKQLDQMLMKLYNDNMGSPIGLISKSIPKFGFLGIKTGEDQYTSMMAYVLGIDPTGGSGNNGGVTGDPGAAAAAEKFNAAHSK